MVGHSIFDWHCCWCSYCWCCCCCCVHLLKQMSRADLTPIIHVANVINLKAYLSQTKSTPHAVINQETFLARRTPIHNIFKSHTHRHPHTHTSVPVKVLGASTTKTCPQSVRLRRWRQARRVRRLAGRQPSHVRFTFKHTNSLNW